MNLGINNSVSGQYFNEIIAWLNCDLDASIRQIFIYNTIYSNSFDESSGVYTFIIYQSIYEYGSYYGRYTDTALNLEAIQSYSYMLDLKK